MAKRLNRMGDGERIEMGEAEIREDLERSTQDAAERAKVAPPSDDDLDYLLELYKRQDRVGGVELGRTFANIEGPC